jgi:murein tripeptide amidase MpaA
MPPPFFPPSLHTQLLRCDAGQLGADVVKELDVWGEGVGDGKVVVRSSELDALGIEWKPACEASPTDIEAMVQSFEADLLRSFQKEKSTGNFHETYHPLDEQEAFYQTLASDFTDLVTLVPSIGQSHEGRDIFALRVTAAEQSPDLKRIYWQCNTHAREWVSAASCMYMVEKLVNEYPTNPAVSSILDNLELLVVPMVNPDGYVFTWTDDRLWRKNRLANPIPSCMGVDTNRNYPMKWGEPGASADPCSQTYRGPGVQSEPEIAASTAFWRQNDNIIGSIDWHRLTLTLHRKS